MRTTSADFQAPVCFRNVFFPGVVGGVVERALALLDRPNR